MVGDFRKPNKRKFNMVSVYTGLYVQCLEDGTIDTVQAVDTAGNEFPLDPDIYISRGAKPDIDMLPDRKDYFLMKEKQKDKEGPT
jgi:hypothetical protein